MKLAWILLQTFFSLFKVGNCFLGTPIEVNDIIYSDIQSPRLPQGRRNNLTDGFVEYKVVCDSAFFKAAGRDPKQAVKILSQIFYQANKYWVKFRVTNVFDPQQVTYLTEEQDIYRNLSTYEAMLRTFMNQVAIENYDSKLLVVQKELSGSEGYVNGVGTVGTACSESCSIILVYRGNLRASGLFLAHEIGHNFGFLHARDYNHKCVCFPSILKIFNADFCVMNAVINFYQIFHGWSNCDLRNFHENLLTHDYNCLVTQKVIATENFNSQIFEYEMTYVDWFVVGIGLVFFSLTVHGILNTKKLRRRFASSEDESIKFKSNP